MPDGAWPWPASCLHVLLVSLHLAVAGVGKEEPALALYEWGGNGKWLVSYFGKMQREMTG